MTIRGSSATIPQDALGLMALIWTLIAAFVNEKRSGSVTLHFADGRFASSEEKTVRRY